MTPPEFPAAPPPDPELGPTQPAAAPVLTPQRRPAGFPPPPRPAPVAGRFTQALAQNLRAAPAGTPDTAIVTGMLRALTPDDLKSTLNDSAPADRHQLFSLLPNDQIATILGSMANSVLAPTNPPAPAPAPTGGPPASILQTTYQNVPYAPALQDPNWAQNFSGGSTLGITSPPPAEWVSVYDPSLEKEGSLSNPMVGLTGWAVVEGDGLSNGDVWFVHPFGFDYEFYIVPDPQYAGLLGASNTGITPGTGAQDGDYSAANASAHDIGLEAPNGVIGVETDQGLLPQAFRDFLTTRTRVATFGRWIVDCGHDDFHTEIHAPLLVAAAKVVPPPAGRPAASDMTTVQIISRPYTVSQRFEEGNFIDHLLAEVAKVELTTLGFPHSWRVEAHPTIFTTPYDGRPYIKLLIQPPPPPPSRFGQNLQPHTLMVSFHFTHRAGVVTRVYDAGNGTVGLVIVLGDLNPATLPPRHDLTVSWSDLGKDYGYVIDALQITDLLLGDFASAIVLQRGILTDIYDPPVAASPLDTQNIATPRAIAEVQQSDGASEDDTQPFPIYGWLNAWWETTTLATEEVRGATEGAPPTRDTSPILERSSALDRQ